MKMVNATKQDIKEVATVTYGMQPEELCFLFTESIKFWKLQCENEKLAQQSTLEKLEEKLKAAESAKAECNRVRHNVLSSDMFADSVKHVEL
mmetsp:Transcript_12161/g.21988  ORF Transcript_12161/g.21988 Transcript_12161/m.21988 type:complete len:92 (-) Transcript_12161:1868-2143(-)